MGIKGKQENVGTLSGCYKTEKEKSNMRPRRNRVSDLEKGPSTAPQRKGGRPQKRHDVFKRSGRKPGSRVELGARDIYVLVGMKRGK